MAIQTIPGLTGFTYARVASMDKRAVGKLTDSNHLESFHSTEPADYDKKIISLYTQSSLYSNDFLDMINKSTPYYIDNNSDAWKWQVAVPYKFPKIVDIPTSTADLVKPGIDGQEFQVVIDTAEFEVKSLINVGDKPEGISTDATENTIVVANWFDNTVSIIDATKMQVSATIKTGEGSRAFGDFISN
jgi:YVTN family beta-propeller protein